MKLAAECVLTKDADGWTAVFPQFGGVATSGKTRDEAVRAARDVLALETADLVRERRPAPKVQHVAEVALLEIEVSAQDAERMEYVSTSEAVARLGATKAEVAALVESGQLATKEFDGQELVALESIAAIGRLD